MHMSDEDLWKVPHNRRPGLTAHATQVRNNGRDDAILYYPGSGADVMHALFAGSSNARYFVFVDPMDLDSDLPTHIMVRHSRLNAAEAKPILGNLRIRSPAAGAWMFSMQGRTRYLFHIRMGHDQFVASNRGFVCDTVFEKDFWETADEIDLTDVLAMLRVGGHYSTNASLGLFQTALALVGLDYVNSYQFNGDQFLYRRRTATRMTWAQMKLALQGSMGVVYDLLGDDQSALYYDAPGNPQAIAQDLTQAQAAMLQAFTANGINVPLVRRRRLCYEVALRAVGGAAGTYISGIEAAFG
jgi:hypothetical protein